MGLGGISKLKIVTLILVFISLGLLIGGMATRWYRIIYSDTTNNNSFEFSFYSPKIVAEVTTLNGVTENDHFSWGDFNLKNTHNIFNTGLAFSAFAFMIGIFMIAITILNQVNILSNVKIWFIARCMVFAMTICTFIAVVVMAGTTNAFKKDYDNADMNDRFIYCLNSCDTKWRGEYSGSAGVIVKFGPSTGWILIIISLFTLISATITSILSFIFPSEEVSN